MWESTKSQTQDAVPHGTKDLPTKVSLNYHLPSPEN